jgi:hypothetical protein
MSQQNTILKQLVQGHTVSKLIAQHLNIGNIYDVIMKLRRAGHSIATVSARDAYGRPYTKWQLTGAA